MRPIRALVLLVALIAQCCDAAECLLAQATQPLVLDGSVEYHREPGKPGFSILLRLAAPICVQGSRRNGTQFKFENLSTIQLGIPANLNKGLRDGDHVALRGEIWAPAENDPHDSVTFALQEVL